MFWVSVVLWSHSGGAAPLGTLPTIDTGEVRLLSEMQSDLWTSPNEEKSDPLRRYNMAVKLPLLNSERWKASFTLDAEGLRIGRPGLIIGDDAAEVNTDLRSQSIGFGVQRQNEAGGWFSLFASYESASNEPFKARRDRYFAGTALYAFNPVGQWQWVVGANQSKNRGVLNGKIMPVAGFFYRPNDRVTVALGFPFLLFEWKEGNTVFNMTTTLVGFEGHFRKDFSHDIYYQFRAGQSERSYLHNGRIDDDNRIFFEEKYFDGGFGVRLSERTHSTLVIGQSFDRHVYEGKAVLKKTGPDQRIRSDIYGLLCLEFIL